MLNNQRVGCNFSHFFHPFGSSVDPSGMVMQLTVHIIVTLGGSKPVENARASKRPRNVVLVADSPRTQLTSILEYFRCVMMCLDGIMMNRWILGSPKQFSDNSNSSFFGSRWTCPRYQLHWRHRQSRICSAESRISFGMFRWDFDLSCHGQQLLGYFVYGRQLLFPNVYGLAVWNWTWPIWWVHGCRSPSTCLLVS